MKPAFWRINLKKDRIITMSDQRELFKKFYARICEIDKTKVPISGNPDG